MSVFRSRLQGLLAGVAAGSIAVATVSRQIWDDADRAAVPLHDVRRQYKPASAASAAGGVKSEPKEVVDRRMKDSFMSYWNWNVQQVHTKISKYV